MAYKHKILVDFDGVVHGYESGWKGIGVCPDPPVPGTRSAIAAMRETCRVYIFSTRCGSPAGVAAIERYLELNDIEVDGVVTEKIPASLSIDDRGFRFNGDWTEVLEFLDSPDAFTPWNKKVPKGDVL